MSDPASDPASDAACCQPKRPDTTASIDPRDTHPAVCTAQKPLRDAVLVPGGRALFGTDAPQIPDDFEGPLRRKPVKPVWWERGAISNAQFRRFVAATGFVTTAEQLGWSFVFHSHVPGGAQSTLGVEGLEWWRVIEGAHWAKPYGPRGAGARDTAPVVHVGYDDAKAYATWAGGRLPKEAEWEHAARGGLGDVPFPWGHSEPDDHQTVPCNIWQGVFPDHDTGADGFSGVAPVRSFEPNGYGLFQMVGNVWEWTAEPFRVRSQSATGRRINLAQTGNRLLKGGSFLCHRSYCYRYRIAARTGNTPDSTSGHTGFRVVYDRAAILDKP